MIMLIIKRLKNGEIEYSLQEKPKPSYRHNKSHHTPVPLINKRVNSNFIPYSTWYLKYENQIETAVSHFESLLMDISETEILPGSMWRMRECFLQCLYKTSENTLKSFV